MEIWNEKDLKRPPTSTYKAITDDIDIPLLHKILDDGIEDLKDNRFLRLEMQLLEKSMTSNTKRFRCHKDFKALQKLIKAIRNFFGMNLPECLEKFKFLLPDSYVEDDTYLPTRNNLEYVLVRLQGAGKLCVRIFETCKVAALYLYNKVCIGQYWGTCMILYAIVSRIFVIIKHTIKHIALLYGKLLLFSSKLQNTNNLWLPHNYKFPKDLLAWLDIKDLESEENVIEIPEETPDLTRYFDFFNNRDSDTEDVEFCGEYIMISEDSDTEDTEERPNMPKEIPPEPQNETIDLKGFDLNDDIGEVIQIDESLDDIQIIEPKVKKTKKRGKKRKMPPS